VAPIAFIPLPPPPAPPFAGFLAAWIPGPVAPSNTLLIDDSALGLLSGGVVVPPGVPAPPILPGSHDNVDAFNWQFIDTNGNGLNSDWVYFTIYPDEAAGVGVSPADIFDVAPGAVGTVAVPYAPAFTMGLDVIGGPGSDSIDALVVYDNNILGGPNWGGPGGEPGIDYALFSLAPGSVSLAAIGLSADDVFLTDFTGVFAVYAMAGQLGLTGVPGGPVGAPDNIDSLEIECRCEPDMDGNGDVSGTDFLTFINCFNGSLNPPLPGCLTRFADLDCDGDVDGVDFLTWIGCFNGALNPPAPGCPCP
jgi:hypothetical protein